MSAKESGSVKRTVLQAFLREETLEINRLQLQKEWQEIAFAPVFATRARGIVAGRTKVPAAIHFTNRSAQICFEL